MHDNLHNATARLLRAMYVVACAIYLIALFALLLPSLRFLDPHTRSALVAVAALPACLFALAYYFYENRVMEPAPSRTEIGRAILTTCFLLVPPILIGARYVLKGELNVDVPNAGRVFAMTTIGLYATGLLLGHHHAGTSVLRALVFVHMRDVMWGAWSRPDKGTPLLGLQDTGRLRAVRLGCYDAAKALRIFQGTLTCPALDSRTAAELLSAQWLVGNERREIDVLDIGGGDGRFTARLATLLDRQVTIREIVMVDPVDYEEEYRAAVGPVVGSVERLSFVRHGLEDAEIRSQFDLVVASHSLYRLCDDRGYDDESRRGAIDHVLDQLSVLVREGGAVVIAKASGRARSGRFKRQALETLFGRGVRDVEAEDLRVGIQRMGGGQPVFVDNLFNLTALLDEWEHGNRHGVCAWLKYFLRYPVDDRAHTLAVETLVGMLDAACMRFDELPEREIKQFQQAASDCAIRSDSRVLLHKTAVWVVVSDTQRKCRQAGS